MKLKNSKKNKNSDYASPARIAGFESDSETILSGKKIYKHPLLHLIGVLTKISFVIFTLIAIVASVYLFIWFKNFQSKLPDYEQLKNYNPNTVTRLYSKYGTVINTEYNEHRIYVPIKNIPQKLQQAFIAAEDKTFYSNIGIDMLAIFKAIINDAIYMLTGHGSLVGGSTITQQVVKNLILTNEKTISRKFKEMILAIKVTKFLKKDEILEIYLNHIFLGNNSYGVTTAAMNYFGKELKDLTISECAILASLPKAPSTLNPSKGFEKVANRRNWVISQMQEDGFINSFEARDAKEEQVYIKKIKPEAFSDVSANAFSQAAMLELKQNVNIEQITDGYYIQTTLNDEVQRALYSAFRKGLEVYDKRHGYRGAIDKISKKAFAKKDKFTDARICSQLLKLADINNQKSDFSIAAISSVSQDKLDIIVKHPSADLKTKQINKNLIIEPSFDGEDEEDKLNNKLQVAFCTKASIAKQNFSWAFAGKQNITKDDVEKKFATSDVIAVRQVDAGQGQITKDYSLEQVPLVNGSAIALDPRSGKVLGMVGGYFDNKGDFNRSTQAMRQTGSVTKPFLYLSAFENGFSPASSVMDAQITLAGADDNAWTPQNSNHTFKGLVSLRYALEHSLNVPTVRLAEKLGINKIAKTYRKLGLYDESRPIHDFSVILGAMETNLISVARAFGIIANGGYFFEPIYIEYVSDKNGKLIYSRKTICIEKPNLLQPQDTPAEDLGKIDETRASKCNAKKQSVFTKIIADDVAYQITSVLEGVVKRGTGIRASYLGLPIAGKTGTTNKAVDSWFVGFSPNVVIAVHVGFDKPQSLGENEYGATISLPIFAQAMQYIYPITSPRGLVPFKVPAGIRFEAVDYRTGQKQFEASQDTRLISEGFKVGDKIEKQQQSEDYDSFGYEDTAQSASQDNATDDAEVESTDVSLSKLQQGNPASQSSQQQNQQIINNSPAAPNKNFDFFDGNILEEEKEEGTGTDYADM